MSNADMLRIVVHPGSGGSHKCWSVERFAAVITNLCNWQPLDVTILGGPADHARLEHLFPLHSQLAAPSTLTMMRDAPLLDVAYCVQRCHAYLGNDSGITHLAALLGVPTLALFGPSDLLTWQPQGRKVEVIAEKTLANISVLEVTQRMKKLLSE
jgi:ADP-heptose:LPS heptosyltransferase